MGRESLGVGRALADDEHGRSESKLSTVIDVALVISCPWGRRQSVMYARHGYRRLVLETRTDSWAD